MRWILAALLALSVLPPMVPARSRASQGQDVQEVVVAGPSWEGFTNRDGTGLYHEILNEVFGLYGIRVKRVYVPSERALQLVKEGTADFQTCYDAVEEPFILAKHPMYANQFHVFFNKEAVGPWQGVESLRDKRVACRIGYYTEDNFSVPVKLHPVKTGVAALNMVILGRMDFYVDDRNFIEISLKENTIPIDMADFDIQPAGSRAYYPVFYPSERGLRIKALYEQGMERLFREGRLQPIFERWGHPVPAYDMN